MGNFWRKWSILFSRIHLAGRAGRRRPFSPVGTKKSTVSTSHPTEQVLLQSEHAAVQALSKLLQLWYAEAGLHGMLRSLDATLSQCHAILDEFAHAPTQQHMGQHHMGQHEAERGAISQHLDFMLRLCEG